MSAFSEVELKVRALDARVALTGVNDERPVHTDNDNPDDLLRREFSLAPVVATATRSVAIVVTRWAEALFPVVYVDHHFAGSAVGLEILQAATKP